MRNTAPPAAGKGRPKGSPNKATAVVREIFARFVECNAAKIQDLFDRVAKKDPAKALDLLARIYEFVVPKLARTELKGSDLGDSPLHTVVTFVYPPERGDLPVTLDDQQTNGQR